MFKEPTALPSWDAYTQPYKNPSNTVAYTHEPVITGRSTHALDDLPDLTMASVKQFFAAKTKHSPSKPMLDALSDIPRTAARILKGEADAKFYLSPIDTGVGKSVTLANTIKHLRKIAPNCGVVICLNRYTLISDMIAKMGLEDSDFAVLVTKGRPEGDLGLGHEKINEAPVLLTTHAMMEKRLLGKMSWVDAAEFHYLGKPRTLRIWDESILPGLPICVPKANLYLLMGLKIAPTALFEEVEEFAAQVASAEHQSVVMIPEFAERYDLQDIQAMLSASDRFKVVDTLESLWRLSGRPARIIRDGDSGNTLVQHEAHLPGDMLPMLVLDASARVRTTYRLQAHYTDNVAWLRRTNKSYERVTIKLKEEGAGKRSFGKNYQQNLREIDRIIRDNPEGKFLVVHPIADPKAGIGNVREDLVAVLQEPRGLNASIFDCDVKFCSWGSHNGTNEFSDRDTVIFASTLFYPNSAIEARARIASQWRIEEEMDARDIKEVRRGELMSDLLQAASRGSMRNLDGLQAHKCTIYLSLAKRGVVKPFLSELFPGSKILKGWGKEAQPSTPGNSKATDQQIRALTLIQDLLSKGVKRVAHSDVYGALGMHRSNFSVHVIRSHYLRAKFKELGLVNQRIGRSNFVVRKES